MTVRLLAALTALFFAATQPANAQCTADAGPPQTLTCAVTQVTLEGSSNVPNATYAWTGPGFTSNMQNPVVNIPGTFTLVITDPSNGCTATATTTVSQDIVPPDVSVEVSGPITCLDPVATISASSTTPGVVYSWSSPSGWTSTQQNPQVSLPGDYSVTVTAPNGCTATAVATVIAIQGSPPFVTPNVVGVSCFGGNDGSIELSIIGGTPPYVYQWSNGYTTQALINVQAGTYIVTVTESGGCSSSGSITVNQPAAIAILPNLITISPVTCFGLTNGAIALPNPTGGYPPFNFSWIGPNGFNANTKNITNLIGGTYTVTITDSKACTKAYQFNVPAPVAPLAISNVQPCNNAVYPLVTGGTQPYAVAWRLDNPNGQVISTQLYPGLLPPGFYALVITDNNGCTATAPIYIGSGNSQCTRVFGRITFDENLNCIADPAENGLGNWYLKAVGANGTFYGIADATGNYVVTLNPGDYTLTLIPQGSQPMVCANDIPITLANLGSTTKVDFAVQLINPNCPDLSVNLSSAILRRCFSNTYTIKYCNNSPAEAPDAYLTLELDPFLEIQAAQLPYTDIGNNTYRFDLGTVPGNFCNTIWVQVKVSCNAVLGQTHCSEARIYPDTACAPPNPQWSGAQLEVRAVCTGDSLRFEIKNIGAGDMTQPLDYIVIEDGIMLQQNTAPPLASQQSMFVSVPANGSTWRIEAKQEPFSPKPEQPVLSVEGCSNTGSFSTGFVNQFPPGDEGPWVDVDCRPNTGSYDPNDKQGFPTGYGPKHYIRPGTELEYLIRFQNTGTDTAFAVVIRDTLSPWLDPLTVQAGAGSHPFRFELAGPGILIFDFQNILLPDSNVNEPASHGFVQFRARPRTDIPLETDIPNRAAIYFDFNDPVITNTTVHRVGENFVTVGLWQPARPLYQVSVAPHPVQEASWIRLEGAATRRTASSRPTGTYQLRIFDLAGKPVRALEAAEPQFLLRKQDLPAGLYFFKIENGGELLGSGKLVVR